MTNLTYTATHGAYFHPAKAAASVPGWKRDVPITANPDAGMRALFFYQPSTLRGVIAFRGTDLDTSGVSGQADVCYDFISSETTSSNNASARAPAFCSKFSAYTLDYWARSRDFVAAVRAKYPFYEILYTGHSLGATLACSSAAADRVGYVPGLAIAFSAGPWVESLRRRTGLDAGWLRTRGRIYQLADQWDPVQASAIATPGSLSGDVCLYDQQPPSLWCLLCFRSGLSSRPKTLSGLPITCKLCFAERHVYSHYACRPDSLIASFRPHCINATEAQLPEVPWWVPSEVTLLIVFSTLALVLLACSAGWARYCWRRRKWKRWLLRESSFLVEESGARLSSYGLPPATPHGSPTASATGGGGDRGRQVQHITPPARSLEQDDRGTPPSFVEAD